MKTVLISTRVFTRELIITAVTICRQLMFLLRIRIRRRLQRRNRVNSSFNNNALYFIRLCRITRQSCVREIKENLRGRRYENRIGHLFSPSPLRISPIIRQINFIMFVVLTSFRLLMTSNYFCALYTILVQSSSIACKILL